MGLKDLFSLKKDNVENVSSNDNERVSAITFEQWGREQAEAMGGSPEVIHPALHAVYLRVKQKVMEDDILQQQRKAEVQSKIDVLLAENENLQQKKKNKDDELQHEERKIEDAKSEITAIKQDPSRVTKQQGSPRVSFIIGLVILCFLTVYLFVFYSSAAYSAFFKEFDPGSIGIATAIFDAQALNKAAHDGLMEIILIITIPAVFLGLGYLIHRFSNDTGSSKIAGYGKIGALMLVTFAFDTILAYEITEKIYEVIRANSFDSMPAFTLSMAFGDMRFWMIIFSGFVVYIIWGLVFNFVMQEYYKLDRVKVAIEELEKKIKDYKTTCKEIKQSIANIDTEISKNNGEIKKSQNALASSIVLHSDVRLEINNFVNGWIAYMAFKGFSDMDKRDVVSKKDAFLASISNQFETLPQI